MNKLMIALMATAFAGSAIAASEPAKMSAKNETPAASATAEKPASAPKKAHYRHMKKTPAKPGMSSAPEKK